MDQKVHNQIVSFIWSIADDVLRDVFTRGKYRDIIIPFTVLRRLDALLNDKQEAVRKQNQFLIKENVKDKTALSHISGYPFWNTSRFTFDLLQSSENVDADLENYLDEFSPNIQDIISKFKLRNNLQTLKEAGLTKLLIKKFADKNINLSPKESENSKGEILPPLTNLGMGYVFEELIRKFNEENNEEAGEHFTPREVIKLMTHLLFLPVKDELQQGTYTIYDPACGSGGMLTEAEQFVREITNRTDKGAFHLYGQEVNPETYAICTSDILIKQEKAPNIAYGSTLTKDGFIDKHFDFMLTNPPYGKTWKIDEDAIVKDRGKKGKEQILDQRFEIGLPSISDGQLLFLTNMVSKMKLKSRLGSRIASVHNGSALFTGDAGSGESEIRRYLIENDLLECIIALPKSIFYNTGIPTYVWILSNKKNEHRKGYVQLINAIDLYQKLRKNLGSKNCELSPEHIDQITQIYTDFKETPISKIFPNQYFGYHKITVEQPLRLAATFDANNLQKLNTNPALLHIAQQLAQQLGNQTFTNYNTFVPLLNETLKKLDLKIDAKQQKELLNAITHKHPNAEKVLATTKNNTQSPYEPDTNLRDTETVPLDQNIQTYFEQEVLPHLPDAWIDHTKTTKGYEVSFTRYFYNYTPPRTIEEISAEILQLEQQTDGILHQIINQ